MTFVGLFVLVTQPEAVVILQELSASQTESPSTSHRWGWWSPSLRYGWLTSEGQTRISLVRLGCCARVEELPVCVDSWYTGSAITLLGSFTFPIRHGILHHQEGHH